MTTHQNNNNNLAQDASRLNISTWAPKQYSPNMGKKIAPVVPPKPVKAGPVSQSSNVNGLSSSSGVSTVKPVETPSNGYEKPEYENIKMSEPAITIQSGGEQRHITVLTFNPAPIQKTGPFCPVGNAKPRPFGQGNKASYHPVSTTASGAANRSFGTQVTLEQVQKPVDHKARPSENGGQHQTSEPSTDNGVTYAPGSQSFHQNADPNYGQSTNYSNPSNYSNSSNYSNASNYSNMANYSDSSNYSNSSNYSDFSNYDQYNAAGSKLTSMIPFDIFLVVFLLWHWSHRQPRRLLLNSVASCASLDTFHAHLSGMDDVRHGPRQIIEIHAF